MNPLENKPPPARGDPSAQKKPPSKPQKPSRLPPLPPPSAQQSAAAPELSGKKITPEKGEADVKSSSGNPAAAAGAAASKVVRLPPLKKEVEQKEKKADTPPKMKDSPPVQPQQLEPIENAVSLVYAAYQAENQPLFDEQFPKIQDDPNLMAELFDKFSENGKQVPKDLKMYCYARAKGARVNTFLEELRKVFYNPELVITQDAYDGFKRTFCTELKFEKSKLKRILRRDIKALNDEARSVRKACFKELEDLIFQRQYPPANEFEAWAGLMSYGRTKFYRPPEA